MSSGISFVEKLLEGFMTGFAIAAGVSLFVFPMTSRTIYFKQSAGLVAAIQGVLGAQVSFLQSMEKKDALHPATDPEEGEKPGKTTAHRNHSKKPKIQLNPESDKLKATSAALGELHGKIHGDIAFAKRETAFGKLDANDIDEMFRLLQNICLPLSGNASVVDIFERIAERREDMALADGSSAYNVSKTTEESEKLQWDDIMKSLHEPFETMSTAIDEGLQHCLYTLELAKPKRQKKDRNREETRETSEDVEANAGISKPEDKTAATHLASKIEGFHEQRRSTLALWCKQRGIEFDDQTYGKALDSFTVANGNVLQMPERQGVHHKQQRQLYLVLYVGRQNNFDICPP